MRLTDLLGKEKAMRHTLSMRACAAVLTQAICTVPLSGAVTVTGDPGEVTPADPAAWTNVTTGSLGVTAGKSGGILIDGGSQVRSLYLNIGKAAGANGSVGVSGSGSSLSSAQTLYVGLSGSGVLTLADGAQGSSASVSIGQAAGSSGTALVQGSGTVWNVTSSLSIGPNGSLNVSEGATVNAGRLQLTMEKLQGNGTINTKGLQSNAAVVFNGSGTGIASFGAGGLLHVTPDGAADLAIGNVTTGSLTVQNGAAVSMKTGYIGYNSGSGTASVSGIGTSVTAASDLYTGYSAAGSLAVSDGAVVNSVRGYVGYTGTGHVTVVGDGSTWNNSAGIYVGNNATGDSLTISEGGTLTGAAGYVANQYASIASVTVSGAGSSWQNAGTLYLGNKGAAMLQIDGGATVTNGDCYFGNNATSRAVISGPGSSWTSTGNLYLGYMGGASLAISNGGSVSSASVSSTYSSSVTIEGTNSVWSAAGSMSLSTNSTVRVRDGGSIRARSLNIPNFATVRLDVSGNNMIVLGDAGTVGAISNAEGGLQLRVNHKLAAGTYTPIADAQGRPFTWTGYGLGLGDFYGGAWNQSSRTLTVPVCVNLAAGTTRNASAGDRWLVVNPATGHSVGVSFGMASVASGVVTELTTADLATLAVPEGQTILGAWNANLGTGSVLLSFDVGSGASNLQVWMYSLGSWSVYGLSDISYDGSSASFISNGAFKKYAMTGVVPEPANLCALFLGCVLFTSRRRARR